MSEAGRHSLAPHSEVVRNASARAVGNAEDILLVGTEPKVALEEGSAMELGEMTTEAEALAGEEGTWAIGVDHEPSLAVLIPHSASERANLDRSRTWDDKGRAAEKEPRPLVYSRSAVDWIDRNTSKEGMSDIPRREVDGLVQVLQVAAKVELGCRDTHNRTHLFEVGFGVEVGR